MSRIRKFLNWIFPCSWSVISCKGHAPWVCFAHHRKTSWFSSRVIYCGVEELGACACTCRFLKCNPPVMPDLVERKFLSGILSNSVDVNSPKDDGNGFKV